MDSRLHGNNGVRVFRVGAKYGRLGRSDDTPLGAEADSGVSHLLTGGRAALGGDWAGGVLDEDDIKPFLAAFKRGS